MKIKNQTYQPISVAFTLCILLGTNCKELRDDFERHPFRLRHFDVHEHPRDAADDRVDGEDASEADGVEHHGQTVGDDDVAYPEGEGAYGNAEPAHAGGEDLRA